MCVSNEKGMAITFGCVRDHHVYWVVHDGGGRQQAGACKGSFERILPGKQHSFVSERQINFLVGNFSMTQRVVTDNVFMHKVPTY